MKNTWENRFTKRFCERRKSGGWKWRKDFYNDDPPLPMEIIQFIDAEIEIAEHYAKK